MTWKKFPYGSDYDYSPDELASHWDRLHQGDREPFPDADWVHRMGVDSEVADEIAETLTAAWCDFHAGRFEQAYKKGKEAGLLGNFVANKAAGIHAVYLVADDDRKLEIFQSIADDCESVAEELPNHANSFYLQAFALGRYSQGISVVKALTQGLGGKIKESLDRTISLEPEHADAHTALGLYHAEIIDKVGKMVGKLTYGASADKARKHFQAAESAFPESPIRQIEYANGLLLLDGDNGYDRASELYVSASEATPMDAMERLDVELAKSELE